MKYKYNFKPIAWAAHFQEKYDNYVSESENMHLNTWFKVTWMLGLSENVSLMVKESTGGIPKEKK